jgi:D-tyrosyl-tRNA(Tyr) deacylase
MKIVVQRVARAEVRVDGAVVGSIGRGALILVGISRQDTPGDAAFLAGKASRLRIFDDPAGRLNWSVSEAGGDFLVVSQFTLYGDCGKGNRPSYIAAATPERGREGYEWFVDALRGLGHQVETGRFQEAMEVELVNDGPVTLILESAGRGGTAG